MRRLSDSTILRCGQEHCYNQAAYVNSSGAYFCKRHAETSNVKTHYVFVYGSLKKGFRLANVLKNEEFVMNGTIRGYEMYSLHNHRFPGIVEGVGVVNGELYRVSDHTLRELDHIEGNGFMYRRTAVEVKLDNERIVDAEVYVYLRDIDKTCLKIPTGYWPARVRKDRMKYVQYGRSNDAHVATNRDIVNIRLDRDQARMLGNVLSDALVDEYEYLSRNYVNDQHTEELKFVEKLGEMLRKAL